MTSSQDAVPRRIGLIGGSFDPPHLGHLALGRSAFAQLALDELRWLPAAAPWQKAGRTMARAEHRARMVEALIAREPRGHVVDRREIVRQQVHGGATYTVDTVRELDAEQPGTAWFLVLGQDQYGRLDTWRDWRAIVDRVTLAVAARDGVSPSPPPALAAHAHRCVALDMPRLDVSATAIRGALAAGTPPRDLVGALGAEVAGYIEHHRLYRPAPDGSANADSTQP